MNSMQISDTIIVAKEINGTVYQFSLTTSELKDLSDKYLRQVAKPVLGSVSKSQNLTPDEILQAFETKSKKKKSRRKLSSSPIKRANKRRPKKRRPKKLSGSLREQIETLLLQRPDLTTAEIKPLLKITKKTSGCLYTVLSILKKKGVVTRDGAGKFRIKNAAAIHPINNAAKAVNK